ncbi:porin family protein [Vibrio ulleungensis]|uniref:Lipoprotein n=1 Tax=Vibrio ulleungensis TaxID=2807619 RepID=A0ABS2HC43_9VIBR|nr:hypothetical protein [Vibrio ulleungensis]MBM7035170.1 hypothetical protein [Vibrio ulleungensis]
MSKVGWIAVFSLAMTGCSSTLSLEEREAKREQIDQQSQEIVEQLRDKYPDIEEQINQSEGYVTISMSGVKVPVVGSASGEGVIYSQQENSRTYVEVTRYDLGAGLGAGGYRSLTLFDDIEQLHTVREGSLEMSIGGDWAVSDSSREAELFQGGADLPYTTYLLYDDSTVGVVGSARVVSVSVNEELTETGEGDAKFPNQTQPPIATKPDEPRPIWDYPLPFFAQEVIDQGYSLPKPFGISLVYAETRQNMSLTDLEAGLPGNGNVAIPMEFVTFDNNYSHSKTPQLKIDAWLFPFMNVFATVGKLNGTAHIEFNLDGNGVLDHLGIDCSGPFKPFACRVLEDNQTPFVPIDVDLDGYNYTFGTVLAGGWRDYFVALPFSMTYVDMKSSKAEELVISASPRVGKRIPLQGSQSLDLFIGASYLDSTLTITGTFDLAAIGMDGEVINYKIKQENDDKWAGLFGANYTFNREWSLSAEYGQYKSDKKQFITSLNYRY